MMKNLMSLLISVMVLAACNSSSSIPLSAPQPPPANPGEQGGDAKPTPTPTATPTPGEPGQPTPGPTATPSPTPTPKVDKVARLYCLDQPGNAYNSMVQTLRADVVETYNISGVRIFNEKNQQAPNLKQPVPLQSDGKDSSLILKASFISTSDWGIYKAKVDLLKGDGTAELLSSYGEEPNQFAYSQLSMPSYMVAANQSRTAFVYPNDRGNFVLQTLDGKKTVLPVSASSDSNPHFVRDTWIVFDHSTGSSLTQRFYSIKSGKVSSISSSSDFQLYGFVSQNGDLLWAEGRPGRDWKLRSSKGTIATLPGTSKNIKLPIAFFEKNGQVFAAYIEEEIVVNDQAVSEAKTANLRILGVSSNMKLSSDKKIEYSEHIKNMARKNIKQEALPTLLRSLFFEPISGKLYASIGAQGGVASYDIENSSWEVHGANVGGCFTPNWGVEVTRE